MKKFLLAGFLAAMPLALCAPRAVAAPRSESPVLPAQVRALTPKGAVSFWGERMSIGYRGSKVFVHIWSVVRPKTPRDLAYNPKMPFYDSPICIDAFIPYLNIRKEWGWMLASSTSYMGSQAPTSVTSHWLRPDEKQGAILDIATASGTPGVSTSHQILGWPVDFHPGFSSPPPL